MIFRIRFQSRGGHVHCRMFQADAIGHTWQKNGDLVFDERGWVAFSVLMNGRVSMVSEEDNAEWFDHERIS